MVLNPVHEVSFENNSRRAPQNCGAEAQRVKIFGLTPGYLPLF
jgi:hypothetical protein